MITKGNITILSFQQEFMIKGRLREQWKLMVRSIGCVILLRKYILDGSVPYHIYWTPELEYPGLMKIAFHGSIGGEINPDQRDQNQGQMVCMQSVSWQFKVKYFCKLSKAGPSERLLKRLASFLEEKFPGINFEDGPAILESCIYTVSIPKSTYRPMKFISDNTRWRFHIGQASRPR